MAGGMDQTLFASFYISASLRTIKTPNLLIISGRFESTVITFKRFHPEECHEYEYKYTILIINEANTFNDICLDLLAIKRSPLLQHCGCTIGR